MLKKVFLLVLAISSAHSLCAMEGSQNNKTKNFLLELQNRNCSDLIDYLIYFSTSLRKNPENSPKHSYYLLLTDATNLILNIKCNPKSELYGNTDFYNKVINVTFDDTSNINKNNPA